MSPRAPALFVQTALLFVSSCVPTIAWGQTTGNIAGTVKDQSGAALVGAEVRVISQATGDERKVVTDELGNYSLPLLSPGLYRVSISAPGFAKAVFENVLIAITETTTINGELRVGGTTDSIIVNAQAPLVQTNGPQLGRVVDSRGVSELPLGTRNITQILGLSPGTATYLPDNTAVGRNTQTISVNGARMTENNYEINGVDANTMGTGSAINVAIPAPESVQEFKVQTSLYDATYGRSGGANIEVITRSGTNSLHGSIYEYLRNDALNANNPFLKAAGVPRPALRRNAFGGSLGGPIHRDRVFFFVSYQGTREANGASLLNSLSSNVLIAPGLTNDRSQPILISTFKVATIDPAALALLNAKLPNGQYLIPTPQSNGRYSGSAISRFAEDQFNADLDARFTSGNSAFIKVFFADAPSTLVLPSFRGTGANVPGFGTQNENNVRVIAIQDTVAFSATLFNEARIGYNRHANPTIPEEPVNDSDVGILRSNAAALPGLPLIRIAPSAGGVVIGTPTNIGPAFPYVATLNDTLTIARGPHTIRTGVEYRYNGVNFASRQFQWGQIDFSSFQNFLLGTTTMSTLGNGIGDRSQRAADYNFFFQDDWKFSPRWTFNLGMRYELDLPPYDTRGRFSTFDPALYVPRPPDSVGNPVGPPLGGFVQAGNVIAAYNLPQLPKVSKGVVKSIDPNNIAPRLGFAFSPRASGPLVMRGGYGIFYSRATFQYVSTSATVPPMYLLGSKASAVLDNPFPAIPPQSQFPTFVPGIALTGTVLDRNIRTPYFQQFNFSVQYQLTNDMLLETAYVGTRGIDLFRQLAINQATLASPQNPVVNAVTGAVITTNTPLNASLRAPFQGVGINNFFQNQSTAQSTYNSLQISLTRRMARGLQLLVSYTYEKSLDDGSGQGGGAGIVGVVNPGAVGDTSMSLGNLLLARANRGVSDFDRTHRLILSYLWDLPAPSFSGQLHGGRLFLSNWQMAGIITAMSGLPIDIVDTGAGSLYGLSAGGNPLARPNLASGASCVTAHANVPSGHFFNPLAFERPVVLAGQPIPSSGGAAVAGAIGTDIGNVGRNCLRGPSQVNVDVSIGKRFAIRESGSFDFRAEFFNLLNHVNLANPISDLNAVISSGGSLDTNTGKIINPGAFGQIISTSNNPRLIQFVLKFSF